MMRWQQYVVYRVPFVVRQRFDLQPLATTGDERLRGFGKQQPAKSVLDRDLPHRESAEVHGVRGGTTLRPGAQRQPWIIGQEPEKRAGVEQERHGDTPDQRSGTCRWAPIRGSSACCARVPGPPSHRVTSGAFLSVRW